MTTATITHLILKLTKYSPTFIKLYELHPSSLILSSLIRPPLSQSYGKILNTQKP